MEISGVSLGTNTYVTTLTSVDNAPSRAKLKTRVGNIVISTTRPHRGAVVQINTPNIIASTGFSVICEIDGRINEEWFLYSLLSNSILQQMLQRSSGGNYPAIVEDEIKKVFLPLVDEKKQLEMVKMLKQNLDELKKKCAQANSIFIEAKNQVFEALGLSFSDYQPSIFSYQKRTDILEYGIYCNPHSAYLNKLFESLRSSKWYAGHLEEFVDVNPGTDRSSLSEGSAVSFVPMTAVEEKANHAEYKIKNYRDVKTGFTIFKKNDLLWAKITPCMQNGKSFLASDMPTDIGFASTEFHVLRQKSDQIYMPYLWVILSEDHILEAAQGMFSGSAGQQRVPDTFLKRFPMVLPPVESQRELADEVFVALKQANQIREEAEKEWTAAKARFEKELLEG